ncbi:GNAT family N-acetyltransferase [Halogeometricum limi]|uniref:Acetyltransferase (GNAT) family protein n=1 Tax=Halogeometricum limi TaxID=555875 RepID=A0A1I6FQA1_9EURY|nr:GNAT family N-acetyltransferase [Halogeometricum limi]SFR32121.1 Acetyltransferase (GNAT) family protein [Halogeometricum limi]
MSVTVRPVASFEEYLTAMRTWRLAWRAAFDHVVPAEHLPSAELTEARRDSLEAVYDDVRDRDAVFVADAGGVVGYAHLVTDTDRTGAFVPDDDAELHALYVRPDRWGEGVGSALLERVESACSEATRLVLQTFAANEDGRAFYRARGFERVGDHTFEVGGESYPTVVLAKPLRN